MCNRPPRLVLPGAGRPPRAQTHNCCRRGDGERCPGQMEARLRQQSVPRWPAPRSARGMPVIPPAAPLIQTLSSPAQRGRLGAHSPSSSGGLIKGLAQNKKPVSRHKMCSPPLVPPRKLKTGACGVRGSLRGRTGRGDEEGKGGKGGVKCLSQLLFLVRSVKCCDSKGPDYLLVPNLKSLKHISVCCCSSWGESSTSCQAALPDTTEVHVSMEMGREL